MSFPLSQILMSLVRVPDYQADRELYTWICSTLIWSGLASCLHSKSPNADFTLQLGVHLLCHHSTPANTWINPRRLSHKARLSSHHSPYKFHKCSSAKPSSAPDDTMCLELYCYFRCIHCNTTQLEEDTLPCTQGLITNQTCPQKKVVGARDWRCCKMCRSGSGRNCWCRVQPGLRVRK